MKVILYLGIFWTIYGILGLFGIQNIAKKYKGKSWTKNYIRSQGVMWLLLGIPWLALYLVFRAVTLEAYQMAIILVLVGLPAIIFSIFTEKKYKKLIDK